MSILSRLTARNSPNRPLTPQEQEEEMGFLDHLEVLRMHIVRSVAAIFICGIIIFCFKDFVFRQIIFGPLQPNFVTYRALCAMSSQFNLGDDLCIQPALHENQLIMTGLGEPFSLHLEVSFVLGFIVAFPYIFWQFWQFISPGLYERERRAARGVVFVCTFLFLLGVAFGYYVVGPLAINWLITYEIPIATHTFTVSSYIENLIMFTLPTGLIFELPIVIFFLAKLGLITHHFMKQYRRHAIVVIIILAAIITPSVDMVSQTLVALPIYILYELSIVLAKRETLRLQRENA